ncbi:MAG: glutathione peroxidase family protein [Planctomycetota bacterium]
MNAIPVLAAASLFLVACDAAPESTPATSTTQTPMAATTPTGSSSVHALTVRTLDGKDMPLSNLSGKVTLVVNVASECGYTPQYKGLQALHAELKDKGFMVLGVPCNDFGGQEPGSAEEIAAFCSSKFAVDFPLLEKQSVKAGASQSPLYAALQQQAGKLPNWNFCKYLVGKDGAVLGFWSAGTAPDSKELRAAIEKALQG